MDSAESNVQADLRILQRFRDGDAAACSEIAAWAQQIVRVRRFGVARCDQDDIVQETLLHVWRKVSQERFVLSKNLRAFVRKIAAARCVDRLRRQRHFVPVSPDMPSHANGPEEEVERESDRNYVRRLVAQEKEFYRQLIEMHFNQGLTYGEIAVRLGGPSENTLRVHMLNCMKSIRSKIQGTTPRRT